MRQTNITKEDAYINREISKQMAGNGFRTFPKGEKGTLQSIKKDLHFCKSFLFKQ